MFHLPQISGTKLVKALAKIGYSPVRQKGSHMRLTNIDSARNPITVPNHKTLGKGILRKILRDTELSVEDFLRLLK